MNRYIGIIIGSDWSVWIDQLRFRPQVTERCGVVFARSML